MKPIFDGVYINQILFRAGTVSSATLAPDKFSPSDARPGSPAPFCSLEWPFESELKRGSIFIRRFLMKHFKCMESMVVPSRGRATPLLHSQPFPLRNLRLLPIVTPRPRYLPHV